MKKITLAFLAVTSLAILGWGTTPANAQGFHIRTGGLHLDIGRVSHHGYYRGYSNYGIRAPRGCVVPSRVYPSPYYRRPPQVIRHGNHLHVVPNRYNVYRSHYRHHPYHDHRGRGHGYRGYSYR